MHGIDDFRMAASSITPRNSGDNTNARSAVIDATLADILGGK
ncbi:hypothetical protein [Subtercola sp. YIM 133946]